MKKTKQYSVERGFISKLVECKDFKLLKDQQIQPFFLTGDNRRVFQYIQEQFKTTGEVPTPRVIKQKFPSYDLESHTVDGDSVVGTDETLLYWCKELRTKAKHNRMADITENVAEKLDNGETEEAYALLKQGVWKIEDEIVESSSVDITKNTDDRKQAYLERKKNKGMIGISTGIPHLDYILKGLIKETLTTVIAGTGVGKTWLLVLLGAYAQLNGYKVVCFITEMSTELMQDRFEAMLFGMMYGDFSYNNFKSGSLSLETENTYFEFLEEDLPKLEPLIIETATGISSVVSVIERTGEIGTMRAIGAEKSFVKKLFFTETLFLTVVSSIIGFIIAFIAMAIFNSLEITITNSIAKMILGGGLLHFSPTVKIIVATFFVAILGSILSNLYPISSALKITPLKALSKGSD